MVSVVVVGAGAAGLMAAKTLIDGGVSDVVVLEANNIIGGRLKKTNFVDFPIDLGGQWIQPVAGDSVSDILDNLLNGTRPKVSLRTIQHSYDPVQVWDGSEFYQTRHFTQDHLWVNYTWFDFFNDNIAIPSVIQLNCVVEMVDTTDVDVVTSCQDGRTFASDHVIITTSIQVLQDGIIAFVPALPSDVLGAIAGYTLANALKVFVEFSSKFYPDAFLTEQDCDVASDENERLFWSESFGEESSSNVLGLFTIGPSAEQYSDVSTNDEALLGLRGTQLDDIFGEGVFSANYLQHVVQDWSKEPYVRAGYTVNVNNWPRPIQVLSTPTADGKIMFAGEGIPPNADSWGFVHWAAYSGRRAAMQILDAESVEPVVSSSRQLAGHLMLLSAEILLTLLMLAV